MNKILLMLCFLLLFLLPGTVFSSYRIELNNQAVFTTDGYWEKGGHIRFYYSGGLISVDKKMVRRIERSDQLYTFTENPSQQNGTVNPADKMQAVTRQKSVAEKRESPAVSSNTDTAEIKKASVNPKDRDAVIQAKKRIDTEMKDASAKMTAARERKDQVNLNIQYKKLLALQKELSTLQDAVAGLHDGQVPEWWDNPDGITPEPVEYECKSDADCGYKSKCVDGYCV